MISLADRQLFSGAPILPTSSYPSYRTHTHQPPQGSHYLHHPVQYLADSYSPFKTPVQCPIPQNINVCLSSAPGHLHLLSLSSPWTGASSKAWVKFAHLCCSALECGSRQDRQQPPTTVWQIGNSGSVAQSCLTLCDSMDCPMQGFPVHHQLLELVQTHVHQIGDASNYLILCCPLLLLPSIISRIRVFSNESVLCIRWPKYWSSSFSISPSSEFSGLISFRMDWFDLLAVQGTLKSLLQHHSSKASILCHSAFFMV